MTCFRSFSECWPFMLRTTHLEEVERLNGIIFDLKQDLYAAQKNDGRDSKGRYSGSSE